MADPIRIYTPERNVREELRRKVESAPVDHAEALLAAYELLQEAQDHGVLDTLRGAIGAGEAFISKTSEYANTPEGIRLMRNVLAMTRVLGELDPALLDAAVKALSEPKELGKYSGPPSWWQTLQRLTSRDSRRALAAVAGFSQAFGKAHSEGGMQAPVERSPRAASTAPFIAVAIAGMVASFWIGRRSLSR